VCTGADGLCIPVLVHDPCGVFFPGLLYRGMVLPGGHILYTYKRVFGDDRQDDQVERRYVWNRARKRANRIFGL
jgi:hypothetical protein